jgi:hypothetical protein
MLNAEVGVDDWKAELYDLEDACTCRISLLALRCFNGVGELTHLKGSERRGDRS